MILKHFQSSTLADPDRRPFDFGFGGGGDEVRIFDQEGVLVDSVSYDDESPWPLEPDGSGRLLN